MAIKPVDPSAVSNKSVLDSLKGAIFDSYIIDSLYAATEIDENRYTLIEQSELYVLFNMAVTY